MRFYRLAPWDGLVQEFIELRGLSSRVVGRGRWIDMYFKANWFVFIRNMLPSGNHFLHIDSATEPDESYEMRFVGRAA